MNTQTKQELFARDATPSPETKALTPMGMIALAVQQGADIDKLSKLLELQERWEATEARKAFVVALRKACGQCQLFPDLAAALGNLRRYASDNEWREEQERSAREATAGNVSYIEALHQRVDDLLQQIKEAA